jgi:hypothetical protein
MLPNDSADDVEVAAGLIAGDADVGEGTRVAGLSLELANVAGTGSANTV